MLKHFNFERKMSPFELLDELKERFDQHSILEQTFESVHCIYQNELSALVPKELFDETNLADYLKFNAKILNSDFITYDQMKSSETFNVYVPLVNINNYIFDSFGSFEYHHSSSILIDTLLNLSKEESEKTLFIHINDHHFEMVLASERQLIFCNIFEFSTKEDFIYYVLFTIEQLELDPEKINTKVLGKINEQSELFEILYTYVRQVDVLQPNTLYQFEDSISKEDQTTNFILLNSFNP